MCSWEYLLMQAAHTCPEIQDSCAVWTTSWVHTLHRCRAVSVTACLATLRERDMALKESLEIYGRIMQQQRWWQTYKSQGGTNLVGAKSANPLSRFLSSYTTDSIYKEWVTETITLCTTYCSSSQWCGMRQHYYCNCLKTSYWDIGTHQRIWSNPEDVKLIASQCRTNRS